KPRHCCLETLIPERLLVLPVGCKVADDRRPAFVRKATPSPQHGVNLMKVKILKWHAVASWTWDAQDETCGICRMAFDGCCPDCKFPGDDCPLIWGACNHAFHLHCILKWVNSQTPQPHCPMCRREWQFKA
ncbi:Anaphase-promoting complex subunit, partial [Musa troglodytarum]